MYQKCANDVFSYCSGEPEFNVEASEEGDYSHGGHCIQDPKTCSKYQTFTQSLRRQVDETKNKLDNWSEFPTVIGLVAALEKKEAMAES